MSLIERLEREIGRADLLDEFKAGCTLSAYHLGFVRGLARARDLAEFERPEFERLGDSMRRAKPTEPAASRPPAVDADGHAPSGTDAS